MFILAAGAVSATEITVFLLSFGVLLGMARLFGEIARKLGQPTVLGEILAGVVLGQTVLAYFSPELYGFLFPSYADPASSANGADGAVVYSNVRVAFDMFLVLCVAFLLLVAGLEVDLSSVWRQGKAAASVSIAGMVIPFALGFGACYAAGLTVGPEAAGMGADADALAFALFVGIAMSITALPVIAKILMDLNMLKSDLGMLVMSSAMVNDLIGWIGFAIVLAMISVSDPTEAVVGPGAGSVVWTIVLTLGFVGGMLTIGRVLVHRSLPYVQANTAWPGGTIAFVLVIALFAAALTEWIGIHSIFGAFIAGVVIGDSAHLKERTRDTIEQFITNIFAPVFFASIALRVNFVAEFDLFLVVGVLTIAIIGKLFGCYLGAKLVGMGPRESWATGFGMCARGAMEIILGQLALEAELITEPMFVAIVIMALVTSLFPGPVMQWLLGQKQRRNLADVIADKRYIPRLSASTATEAIRELTPLAAAAIGHDADELTKSVLRRERIVPTGLEHGLAVPHAAVPGLKKPTVVIGVSEHGVDFNSRDGEPAHIICLLISSAESQTDQIELLDMVARAFADEQARDAARWAGTFTEFKAALTVHTTKAAH